jgi:ribonuclease P/MRP protein subunit RPP40
MFEFHDANIEKEKCYTTIGKFPAIADSENLPAKKIPFSTAAGYPFIHTVT